MGREDERLTLSNDRIELVVDPVFGARITALTDLASGRQWLVAGECSGGQGDGAPYLGNEARGWDECFPTVAPCRTAAWGDLRDHGVLWGRRWDVEVSGNAVRAMHSGGRFEFGRTLSLRGSEAVADYWVQNIASDSFPYMWSQHCLLQLNAGDRIKVAEDAQGFAVSGGVRRGRALDQGKIDWPRLAGTALDLSEVLDVDERLAVKLYAHTPEGCAVGASGPDGGIRFRWERGAIRALGLWFDYGGWPPDNPMHQVALEPTTAFADDLAEAEAMSRALVLEPGDRHEWSVRIELTEP